jgi:hypothetical protein
MEVDADRVGRSWSSFTALSSMLMALAVLVAIFLVDFRPPHFETSMIRIANDSGVPLQNVRVNDIPFGDLPVNGVSRYYALTPAYRYAALRLEVAGKKFEMIPDDYVGETPLGQGSFTYRIQRQYYNGAMYFDVADATSDSTE